MLGLKLLQRVPLAKVVQRPIKSNGDHARDRAVKDSVEPESLLHRWQVAHEVLIVKEVVRRRFETVADPKTRSWVDGFLARCRTVAEMSLIDTPGAARHRRTLNGWRTVAGVWILAILLSV